MANNKINENDIKNIERHIKKDYFRRLGIKQEELDEFESNGVLKIRQVLIEKTSYDEGLKGNLAKDNRDKIADI